MDRSSKHLPRLRHWTWESVAGWDVIGIHLSWNYHGRLPPGQSACRGGSHEVSADELMTNPVGADRPGSGRLLG